MTITKDTVLSLELTIEEINHIMEVLQELPAKICNPLSIKIKQQADQQLQQPENAAE